MSGSVATSTIGRKGQPLRVLGALLLLWCGARWVLWQSPFPAIELAPEIPSLFVEAAAPEISQTFRTVAVGDFSASAYPTEDVSFTPFAYPASAQPVRFGNAARPVSPAPALTMLASHQLLWTSALSTVPVAPEIAAHISSFQPSPGNEMMVPASARNTEKASRWSFDSWLFLRPGSNGIAALSPNSATYGASQAGAVLRYRLVPGHSRKPSAYVRATRALVGAKESDFALGLSTRPLARIPLIAQAELRASRRPGETEIRPAAFLVTELPSVALPFSLRAAAYGQAGYVGGEFATPFADGQARLDREVVDLKLAKLRAGAGVWGGAQKGAARLDVGPTASVDVKIGKAPARLSMDYRYRVAGDAEPQSGVAITLSTGF